jgi:hypothetical protein
MAETDAPYPMEPEGGSVNSEPPLLTAVQLAALRKRLPNHKCPLGDEIARLYDKETAKNLFNDEQFLLGARFLVVGANAILSEPGVFGEPLLATTINRALNTALHDLAQGRVESLKAQAVRSDSV